MEGSSMRILIDGYNLMHMLGLMKPRFGPGGLEKARRALLHFLDAALGESAGHATVVFDSSQPEGSVAPHPTPHRVQVVYAQGLPDADTLIEQLIHQDPTPKHLRVVSSDSRIQRAARRRHATAVDSERFAAELIAQRRSSPHGAPPEPEKPTRNGRHDRTDWLREFSQRVDPDDLAELQQADWEQVFKLEDDDA
jgi:hypothetical protein